MPPLKKASAARRNELKMLLQTITMTLTGQTGFKALVRYLHISQDRTSHWLHWGEVQPWPAAKMTKEYELHRRKLIKEGKSPPQEIQLHQLVPSLFLPN